MRKHQGKILHSVLKAKRCTVDQAAKYAGRSRSHLYNVVFQQEAVEPEILFRIGRKIKHDFLKEFPELKEEYGSYLEEQETLYLVQKNGKILQLRGTRNKLLSQNIALIRFQLRIVYKHQDQPELVKRVIHFLAHLDVERDKAEKEAGLKNEAPHPA